MIMYNWSRNAMRTLAYLLVLLCCAMVPYVAAHQGTAHTHAPLVPIPEYNNTNGEANGESALLAAEDFLSTLSRKQHGAIVFERDADERAGWSNLPAGIVTRAGLRLGDLSDKQIEALFTFLSASLSEKGYYTVAETLAAEAVLSADRKAEQLQWAPENYWLSFYGTPSATDPWGWQFGGHHLGINMAIADNVVTSMSPTFVGTEPATFTYKDIAYEPVRDMHRAGLRIYNALNTAQKKIAASLGTAIIDDVITGPGQDGVIPPLTGIAVSSLSATQKKLVILAIREWVEMQPEENTTPRMAELEAELNNMRFVWSGNVDGSGDNYFRIQGPTLIIELLSQADNVGASAQGLGHYHTIYRNTTNEYGGQR